MLNHEGLVPQISMYERFPNIPFYIYCLIVDECESAGQDAMQIKTLSLLRVRNGTDMKIFNAVTEMTHAGREPPTM